MGNELLLLQPAWLRWLVERRNLARHRLTTVRELVDRLGEGGGGRSEAWRPLLAASHSQPLISTPVMALNNN